MPLVAECDTCGAQMHRPTPYYSLRATDESGAPIGDMWGYYCMGCVTERAKEILIDQRYSRFEVQRMHL